MADKPIKRDSFEAVEEAGYSAGKFALGAYLGSFAIGALAVVAPVLAGALIFGGGAGVATMFTGGWGLGVAAVAGLAGLGSAITYGTGAAAIGGLFGLVKGASRTERENAAYLAKSKEKLMGREAEMVAVHNNAMQEGYQAASQQAEQMAQQAYMAGQQAGAQMVISKLQEHAQQEQGAANAPAAEHAHGHAHEHAHTHHEEKPKSFAAAITADRDKAAAAAVAGATLGA
ncbi:MAG: hypothetical protein SFX19_08195 [Alphaproteobacteria bacterium]|nr:hypothetical protein [Alphaproteobacteria bacterium]